MQSPRSVTASQDGKPVLRSLSSETTARIWLVLVVGCFVAAWCVLDSWNHDMNSQLFQLSEVRSLTVDPYSGTLVGVVEPFKYTLVLAFLQFAFMGLAFCLVFALKATAMAKTGGADLANLWASISDRRWPALVGTHVFGSLLLQSLMMPTHAMSLSLFAATRSLEVPIAAGVRHKMLGARLGCPSPYAVMMMFAAAWLLFYSYTQIAECLCVWSGFGVALEGAPLYVVYLFLLTVPATNTVLQESVLVNLEVSPILMQGVQSLCAAVALVPILIVAHWLGYEDVHHAVLIIVGHRKVYMTVVWLCVQTTALSAVSVGLILSVDSFWTVAAQSLRVVFWWGRQLSFFYMTGGTLLSVARPHASLWSFVMLSGTLLGLSAMLTDSRHDRKPLEGKRLPVSSESRDVAKGLSMGKYV